MEFPFVWKRTIKYNLCYNYTIISWTQSCGIYSWYVMRYRRRVWGAEKWNPPVTSVNIILAASDNLVLGQGGPFRKRPISFVLWRGTNNARHSVRRPNFALIHAPHYIREHYRANNNILLYTFRFGCIVFVAPWIVTFAPHYNNITWLRAKH